MNKRPGDSRARHVVSEPVCPVKDADVRALLDHLASELAEEYVRLMKEGATEERLTTDEEEGE